jgi:hypothetical protein
MNKTGTLIEIAKHHEALGALYRQLAGDTTPSQSPPVQKDTRQNGGQYKEFDAHTLIKTYDDNGELRVKIKGAPFEKFGVPVYEEDFSILGIDLDELKPGAHAFSHRVKAVLKDDGNPRKIVEVL